MTMSSSSVMTQRALFVISPKALLSLGLANLCCSANLRKKSWRLIDVDRRECSRMAERGTLLVEVSSIQPDDNVTVAQTTVIGFKIADVFKLAFGHVVDGS